jgi:hypothetical protein
MARYIDAEEFFEGFCIYAIGQDKNFIKAVETVLEDTPTADVVEVKHGEWIPIVKQDNYLEPPYCDSIKCSECGQEADVSFHDAKYCFECGAIMDGGKTDGEI